MDLQEWEILPEDEFLDIQFDDCKKKLSTKYFDDDSNNLYKNNYFICPSQKLMEATKQSSSGVPKQPLSVPNQLSTFHEEQDSGIPLEGGHDPVSQVFFKKMVENNKSVDMKMDSPKSNNKGIIPQVEPATIRFENEGNPIKDEALESKNSLQKTENEKVTWGQDSGGVNIWKLSLNGFGAICSFGVVAASICIIILGGGKQNKQPHQLNQKVPFHIFAQDKRMKQVVHHATRLNEAISTMRGVQGVRAHITVGGCYEGL